MSRGRGGAYGVAMKEFSAQLSRRSSATPEAIYDSLADLGTHMTWGERKQLYNFRLRSLEAPAGPAIIGTSFTSTGNVPMSMRRFEDHSKVTVAARPNAFEFVTDATIRRGKRPMAATYRHLYEIAATPEGVESHVHNDGTQRDKPSSPAESARGQDHDLAPGGPVHGRAWVPEPGETGRAGRGARKRISPCIRSQSVVIR